MEIGSKRVDVTVIIAALGIVAISYLTRLLIGNLTLRLFPELSLLRTHSAREKALQAAKPFFRVPSAGGVMYFAALALSVPCAGVLKLMCPFPAPTMLFMTASFGVILLFLSVGNLVFAKSRITSNLRRQLVQRTIPVCLTCGYDLRGQTELRCPECGTPFSPELAQETPARAANGSPGPEGQRCASADPSRVEVYFEYTDELLRASMTRYWWRLHGKNSLGVSVFYVAFLVPCVYHFGDRWFVGAFGVLPVISVLSALRAWRILVNAALKKWRKQADRTVRLVFTDRGVESEAADGHSVTEWPRFEKLWRFANVWLLFQSEYEPIVLPCAALNDQLKELIVRRLLREGLEVS